MQPRFSRLVLLAALMSWGSLRAANAAEIHDPDTDPPLRGFVTLTQATSWEEALISGNGTIGALVMGRPLQETIIFNHERLFMPWDNSQPVVNMAPRRADGGGVMSFGLVQLGQAAASLGEAELAYEAVDMLSNVYWRPNMVSTHNPDSIFNVDICGGMPAVIIKMLVASRRGKIELLPALPDQWPLGSIAGVRCRGQIELDRLVWNGAQVAVTLRSEIEQKIEVAIGGGIQSIAVGDGDATIHEPTTAAEGRSVTLPAGRPVTLNIIRGRRP